MSDPRPPSTSPALTPPPGAIFELAERAVDFVRHAVLLAEGHHVPDRGFVINDQYALLHRVTVSPAAMWRK